MFAVSLALVAQEFAAGKERGDGDGRLRRDDRRRGGGRAAGGRRDHRARSAGAWVFFLNVPIGIAAIAVTFAKLRESRDPNATRVDWLGLATFCSAAVRCSSSALLRGNDEGWGSTLIVALFAGAGRDARRLRR